MDRICDEKLCTGCGACQAICVKNCITMIEGDEVGTILPQIDQSLCINCNACKEVCHANSSNQKFSYPIKAYAARSSDLEIRSGGASGGIASSFLLHAISSNIFAMATFFDRKKGVFYKSFNNKEDLIWARDSKYVFSSMDGVYKAYEEKLKNGTECLFIGLPCQVNGLKQYLIKKKINLEKIVFIEIVCHGVPNLKYLNEHLKYIENKKRKSINKVLFRTPNSAFNITCYSGEKMIWEKGMHADDEYFRGFSIGLFYRESCYNCKYARKERTSDITLGDYSGLGSMIRFEGDPYQMSVVLCNSEKGANFFDIVSNNQDIERYLRPVDESLSAKGNSQLRGPSVKDYRHDVFIDEYKNGLNFEKACRKAMGDLFFRYYFKSPFIKTKRFISKHLSTEMKKTIRGLINRNA